MSLFDSFFPRRSSQPPISGAAKLSKPKPSADSKPLPPKSLFGSKNFLSRLQLREKLRKDSGQIPGTGSFYSREQREKLEKEVFGKEFGEYISPDEFKRAIKKLRKQEFMAKTGEEKREIDRKVRYLEKLREEQK